MQSKYITVEAIKANWKRYLVSSAVTFVSAFLLFFIPEVLAEDFNFTGASLAALALTATRIGVKAVWEIFEPILKPEIK